MELDRAVRVLDTADVGTAVTGALATRWLYQYDIGTQLGEDQPGQMSPIVCEVKNTVGRQHEAQIISVRLCGVSVAVGAASTPLECDE